ncbi:glycosyltransferase family 4 protein [Aquimarina sp. RZ0]|uniref:glycosyltransferase family 4 protein n=1 Tax=Aquimarina sp. RZ0 TaxID=2607730 RepID=UPI0011F28EAA|nr:glycosyltransferase family 4 protein [Aquimarina sp. RZ0]KAA1246950.1 glycosyltransferase family 4 protein [Aquimarina sp. RZ0]
MKTKVDFVISTLNGGGAERVMTLVTDYLANRDYDVSIITFNKGDAYELNPKINRVKLYSENVQVRSNTIKSIYSLKKYYNNKSNLPDIIIAFTTSINLIAIIVAKLCGLKVIVSEHNNHLNNLKKKLKFTKQYVYRYADLVTVLTSYDIDYYMGFDINVIVMPNPCTFEPFVNEEVARNKVILAVGNLNRYHVKGFDNLITIVDSILEENPAWKLKIVGDGDKTFIKDLVMKTGIQEQVEFTNFTKKISELMQCSEIFILPSRNEGLPMVLLEAMSQGMACIAYDCKTGPSDIIDNNINGLLVEDQDIDQMQMKLRKMMNSKDLRDELRQNAIRITDKYSLELIGEKWEKTIYDVINYDQKKAKL